MSSARWLRGHIIENVPLGADTVDVIISHCVVNLSADKPQVFREAARVLKPVSRRPRVHPAAVSAIVRRAVG